jgi:predicted dehydrogenase
MDLSNAFNALVIGYGSIGYRHAKILAALTPSLAIVNRREDVRIRARRDHPGALVVEQLEELDRASFSWKSTLAVIATWGPSHAEFFHKLADRGVRHILCEKPMASSVADACNMMIRAGREQIVLGVNQCMRYAGIVPALRRFFQEHELGEPVAVVVEGGAGGIVTNGIHWVDFATELFGTTPQYVVATARGEPINPRSPALLFYGGTATWRFDREREATISFSNRSSLEPVAQIFLRDAVVEITYASSDSDVYLHAVVRSREKASVVKFPAVTRTGQAGEKLFEGRLPGVRMFLEGIQHAVFDVLQHNACVSSPQSGVNALDSCIGALVSAREGRYISLPSGPTSSWREENWPIS